VPRDVSPGQYFIGAIVDMAGQVDELDETNNTGIDPAGVYICGKLAKPKPSSPPNRATGVSTTPLLDWSDVAGASQYEVQVALDSRFENVVRAKSDIRESQWTVTEALSGGTTYFWRVRALDPCGSSSWSPTRKMGTAPIF